MPRKSKRPARKRRAPKKKPEPKEEEVEDLDLSESEEEVPEVSSEEKSSSDEKSSETSEEEPEEESPKKKAPPKKPRVKTESGKRYFKILTETIKPVKSPKIDTSLLSSGGGRYTGNNPMQAAKKAFTRIARAGAAKSGCTYIFSIQETTQGSAKKVFEYIGVREELKEPQSVKKGDTEYKVRFHSKVRSHKKASQASKKK